MKFFTKTIMSSAFLVGFLPGDSLNAQSPVTCAAVNRPAPLQTDGRRVRSTTQCSLLTFSQMDPADRPTNIPPESYTRLVITNLLEDSSYLPNGKRKDFDRLFSSKDVTFQASLTTDTGRFKEVTPLIFRRYESGRGKGENFVREVTFDDRQFPLFLVTGDPTSQIAKFTLDVSFSNKPATDAAALSFDFLSTALKAISPTSAVVTSLTSESAEKVANKIDQGLGQFFSVSATEKSRFDLDLYDFRPVILTVYGGRYDDTGLTPNYIIGNWKISFATARPSIFSSVECPIPVDKAACPLNTRQSAYNDAIKRPNAVLSFALIDKIGTSGTVLSYLKQQDWWASDLGALKAKGDDFDRFCRKIRGTMGEIGLSDTDGRIIAYSISQSGSVTKTVKTEMEKSNDCKGPPS